MYPAAHWFSRQHPVLVKQLTNSGSVYRTVLLSGELDNQIDKPTSHILRHSVIHFLLCAALIIESLEV